MKAIQYLLSINSRGYSETFDNKSDLVAELKYRGLPLALADFEDKTSDRYGMATNNYQNVRVTAYDESAFA